VRAGGIVDAAWPRSAKNINDFDANAIYRRDRALSPNATPGRGGCRTCGICKTHDVLGTENLNVSRMNELFGNDSTRRGKERKDRPWPRARETRLSSGAGPRSNRALRLIASEPLEVLQESLGVREAAQRCLNSLRVLRQDHVR